MNFVIYDPTSGEIYSYGLGDGPEAPPGMVLLPDCDGTYFEGYVTNGVYTPYTTNQISARQAVPSYPATWSNTSFSWVDSRSLSDAKTDTWNTIRNARDANLAAGFMWNGYKFDSDDISIQRIMGAVQLATLAMSQSQPFSIVWTLFDNSTLSMSGIDLISMYVALGTFTQACFTAGVAFRTQIDAATSNSQLDSITWSTIS